MEGNKREEWVENRVSPRFRYFAHGMESNPKKKDVSCATLRDGFVVHEQNRSADVFSNQRGEDNERCLNVNPFGWRHRQEKRDSHPDSFPKSAGVAVVAGDDV